MGISSVLSSSRGYKAGCGRYAGFCLHVGSPHVLRTLSAGAPPGADTSSTQRPPESVEIKAPVAAEPSAHVSDTPPAPIVMQRPLAILPTSPRRRHPPSVWAIAAIATSTQLHRLCATSSFYAQQHQPKQPDSSQTLAAAFGSASHVRRPTRTSLRLRFLLPGKTTKIP